jgi:hypothetical protein
VAGTFAYGLGARPQPDGALARRPVVVAGVVASALAVLFLLSKLTGQDLSAQMARADFARDHALTPVDFRWFGGTLSLGYSLWVPWVASVVGVRLLGVAAAIIGSILTTRLLQYAKAPHLTAAAVAVAVCQLADVAVGRVTFQVGLTCALGATVCIAAKDPGLARRAAAIVLGALAGAASPVVTLELWIVALALFVKRERRLDAVLLAMSSTIPSAIISLVFADGSLQQFQWSMAVRALGGGALVLLVVPRQHRTLRLGTAISLVVVLIAWVVPSQIGSNAIRLGLLFGIPCVIAFSRWGRWATAGLAVIAVVIQPPVSPEIPQLWGEQASRQAYYQPLVDQINSHGPLTGRVETPEQSSHWDAALLAKSVPLARGWLRQVDTELNEHVFFDGRPTVQTYRDFLRSEAVQYVAIPDTALTTVGEQERDLVATGLPYLRRIWHNADWTLYLVDGATSIAEAPARLVRQYPDRIEVYAPEAMTVHLRLRWFKWLTVTGPIGTCVTPSADNEHVDVHTTGGGTVVISSSLSAQKQC